MEKNIKYIFDSELYTLFEVKYSNTKETDKSKLYQWFLYDKMNEILQKLDFVSMSDDERVFKQGKLYFNAINATFEINNNQIQFNSLLPNSKQSHNIIINIFVNQLNKK